VQVSGGLIGAGSAGLIGYAVYLHVATGSLAATGTTTVLAPALMVAGAMIAVGVNQVNHSTAMINTFGKEMADM